MMAKGRKTGGRTAGTPNKTTAEIRDVARQHADAALAELARILTNSVSDTARIAAARELLDRAYGKAPQAMTGEGGEGPQHHRISWEDGEERKSTFDEFLKDCVASACEGVPLSQDATTDAK
jgi:hypothetical protein